MDDEPDVLAAMGDVVRALGAHVELAPDGADAIAKMRGGTISLVVLDLNLPGISGLRVLEWMSQHAQEVPVLVVTGLENPPNVLNRFPNLVRIMEKKPVPNEVLRHLVETYAVSE